MRTYYLALFLLLGAPNVFGTMAGAPNHLLADSFEPDISVTSFGIDLVSNGVCTPGGNPADCAMLNGTTELTVGSGAAIALYLEWTNDGVTTIVDVVVTDENDEKLFENVTDPLAPGESASAVVFFDAPMVPGQYVVPLTITATNADTRQATALVRYTLNVDAALPVTLQTFTASVDNKQAVELSWSTSWEENNAGFKVERKVNRGVFRSLPGTPDREVGTREIRYHFLDETAPPGDVFYRLRQDDVSGAINYSRTLQVTIQQGNWLPYPNPVTDRLFLPQRAKVTMYHATGRIVLNQITSRGSLDVSHLPPGQYWLLVNGAVMPIVKR